jgi:hypothetical protein
MDRPAGSVRRVKGPIQRLHGRLGALISIVAGAVLIRLIAGVAFANYDTLYALSWGGQLARGETPAYGIPIAPTPHPLLELLGLVLYPLGARAELEVILALAFGALAACGWVIYSLGRRWFGAAAGLLAAAVFETRAEVLNYGVRAYLDIPYLLFVLGAVLVEVRRPRAGAPVLGLLALAGLLRPEAWVFSGLYWLYLMDLLPAALRTRLPQGERPQGRGRLAALTLLTGLGPLLWLGSDLLVTGQPLWSLTNTRHTASTLDRTTGLVNVPEYIPKRLGEILRPPVLLGAGIGGILTLRWTFSRALPGALLGVLAVLVFAAFATVGLPINTRYAFLAAAILCLFCGAGVLGWMTLEKSDPRRRIWMALGAVVALALLAYGPSDYREVNDHFTQLARQERIENDLTALVGRSAINLRCGPVGVANHAPIPLLSLYLKASPERIRSAEFGAISAGVYVDPASREVERDYQVDKRDPHGRVSVPAGFVETASNRSWRIYGRCR